MPPTPFVPQLHHILCEIAAQCFLWLLAAILDSHLISMAARGATSATTRKFLHSQMGAARRLNECLNVCLNGPLLAVKAAHTHAYTHAHMHMYVVAAACKYAKFFDLSS